MLFAIDALTEVHDCTLFTAYDGVRLADISSNLWAEAWEEFGVAAELSTYNAQLNGGNILAAITIGSYDPGTVEAAPYTKLQNCEITLGWNQPAAVYNKDTFLKTTDIQIIGCHIYGFGPSVDQPCIKLTDGPIENVRIEGCSIKDALQPIVLDGITNTLIVGNTIANANDVGISGENLDGLVIASNIFDVPETSSSGAIQLNDGVANAIIQGNMISGGGASGNAAIALYPTATAGPIAVLDNFIDIGSWAAIDAGGSGVTWKGLVVKGNHVIGEPNNGAQVGHGFIDDVVYDSNTLDSAYINCGTGDRAQLLNNIVRNPGPGVFTAFNLGPSDEAFVHGCALVNGALTFAVVIPTGATNTMVRDASNNWRGSVSGVDDNGTGTIT